MPIMNTGADVMQVIGNHNSARKSKFLRYPRAGLYLLEGLACISLIAIGTIVLGSKEKRKHQQTQDLP